MEHIPDWIANLNEIEGLSPPLAGLICIVASAICGTLIGLERERRDKPAGPRTVVMICLGSTIFTIVSILMSQQKAMADPARLAAQVVTGVGFLGAGAIIRARGTVIGLTTGATIWAVAAVGVTIGAGYVAAGVVFTVLMLFVLTAFQHLSIRRCRKCPVVVVYGADHGKAWPRLQAILDAYGVRDRDVRRREADGGLRSLETTVCTRHRDHRTILAELAELRDVTELRVDEG